MFLPRGGRHSGDFRPRWSGRKACGISGVLIPVSDTQWCGFGDATSPTEKSYMSSVRRSQGPPTSEQSAKLQERWEGVVVGCSILLWSTHKLVMSTVHVGAGAPA